MKSKVAQGIVSPAHRLPGQGDWDEAGTDVPDVFTLPPLSQTQMTARIVKVQPASFFYVADAAPSDDEG